MRLFCGVLLLISFAAGAVHGAEGEARAKFLEGWRDRFAHSRVVAADTVEPENDFLRAKGESKWYFILPYGADDRVRILEGTVKKGKFTKGVLHTFGFQPEKISATRFEKLRKEFPMVARRTSGIKAVKKDGKTLAPRLALYPPLSRPLTYRAPAHPEGLHLDPCAYALGYLRGGLRSLGIDLGDLRYRMQLAGPEGVQVVLGVGTADKDLHQKVVVAAIRKALETKWPARVGAVSDSDVVEFYGHSTVTLTGVKQ